jgi:hypothetical protein
MSTATTTRPTLTEVKSADGSPKFADAGATNQGGRAAIKECSACHGYVVFVQSKAGKWYLADCSQYRSDSGREAFYYRKDKPHFKSCETRQTRNAEMVAEARRHAVEQAHKLEVAAATQAFFDDAKNDDLGRDEFLSRHAALIERVLNKYAD